MLLRTRDLALLIALPALAFAACESSKGGETTPTETTPAADFGHCTYTNKFSQSEECRQYEGTSWTESTVADDCSGQKGKMSAGPCSYDQTLGTCVLGDKDQTTLVVVPGTDASKCSGNKLGCETFGGGTFEPTEICKGDTPSDPNASVFQPPERICKDPIAGEPAGMSEGGKVCTWDMISGCTEPGRKFVDYASCGPVYTQRPYYPVPPPPAQPADERLKDPNYVTELGWVKEQVEACACVCCHQESITPKGAGVWNIEAEGNWVDTFSPYGLAFAAGIIPSWPLGAYPADQNNGFTRDMPDAPSSGMPSTDPARMAAFFKAELEHRGVSVDQYAGADPTPSFFYQQVTYKPTACDAGSGVAAGGAISWAGGDARYIYVLEAGSDNPGVPPNLDMPQGTVWRVDVHPDQKAIKSGELTFGKVPASATQAFPAGGAPALTPGKSYYLYVLADVGVPITRCLFDAK